MTIKELRTEKKLSQTAFAESIGVSASTIGDIERGRTKVSPKVAEAVKNVYGVEVELGEAGGIPGEVAVAHGFGHGFLVFTDKANI